MYIYDYIGTIYDIEPTDETEGVFKTDDEGNVLHHVNSLQGRYPEADEPFRIDPDPSKPRRLFAGVELEAHAFFAFMSKAQAEETFGVNQDED